jgi:hypothetical protein
LVQRFRVTFTFKHESPSIDVVLQALQSNIFSEEGMMEVVSVCRAHRANIIVHELLECYNVAKEENDEEDHIFREHHIFTTRIPRPIPN